MERTFESHLSHLTPIGLLYKTLRDRIWFWPGWGNWGSEGRRPCPRSSWAEMGMKPNSVNLRFSTKSLLPASSLRDSFSLAKCKQYLHTSTPMNLRVYIHALEEGPLHYGTFISFSLGFFLPSVSTRQKILFKKKTHTNCKNHPYFKSNFTSALKFLYLQTFTDKNKAMH